jgi:hypothetical protein
MGTAADQDPKTDEITLISMLKWMIELYGNDLRRRIGATEEDGWEWDSACLY